METSKLKNIVLLILLVTNLLLLLLLGTQRFQRHKSEAQALDAAIELLEEKGIAVDAGLLPRKNFPSPLTVEPNAAQEQDVFTALLGENATLTQRGLVSYYAGAKGTAELRGDGTFYLSLLPGAYPAGEAGPERHALELMESLGFQATVTSYDGQSVTLLQSQDGRPVFSCQAQAVYQDGSLVSVSGHRLPGSAVPSADPSDPLSLATLLTRFRSGIIESGDACGAILEAAQGYLLVSASGGEARLVPVLRVVTDANTYYVNALTGELQRA